MKTLGSKRLNALLKEVTKYSKLIFNDHFAMILFILFAFGALYYKELFESIQEGLVPPLGVLFICALLLGSGQVAGRPLWLTEEADPAYLMPQGNHWAKYWIKGTLLGNILPGIFQTLLIVLLYPFIQLYSAWQASQLFLFILLSLGLKVAISFISYFSIYDPVLRNRKLFLLLVMTLIYVLSFILSSPYHWLVLVGAVIVALVLLYSLQLHTKSKRADFLFVVESERARRATFYKFIALFADVPSKKEAAKRRPYLDQLLQKVPIFNGDRYRFLYSRLLLRSGNYSGIWLRLTIFFTLLLVGMPSYLGSFLLIASALILTTMQLLPLSRQYSYQAFQRIYPSRKASPVRAMQVVIGFLLAGQALVFLLTSALILEKLIHFALLFGGTIVFLLLIVGFYIPWRLSRNSQSIPIAKK